MKKILHVQGRGVSLQLIKEALGHDDVEVFYEATEESDFVKVPFVRDLRTNTVMKFETLMESTVSK